MSVLQCPPAFTNIISNAYRFAVPAEMILNETTYDFAVDYTQLLFYQAISSGVSSFFNSPSNIDITQGNIVDSSPLNTVTVDYIKQSAVFFFGDRKANVMFTNTGSATTEFSTLVADKLATAFADFTVYQYNTSTFESDANIALLLFKTINYSDPTCFSNLTPANALRTFTHPNNASGITYYEYGLPIMAGDSIVIHLQIQPNSSQMIGQAWEPVKTGTPPTRDYSIKLICG
jgi:hypothetical protein